MKFAATLSTHLTPEWRKQYIDYDGLKEFLLSFIDKKTRETKDWDADFVAYIDEQDTEFFDQCVSQLQKVESFFAEKLAESKRRYATLVEELDSYFPTETSRADLFKSSFSKRHHGLSEQQLDHRQISNRESTLSDNEQEEQLCRKRLSSITKSERRQQKTKHKKEKKFRKLYDLKLAFSEFYLSLILLQNYQVLNFTGFRKILKKHDKLFRRENGTHWRKEFVDGSHFNTNREIDELIANVEDIYTEKLEHGDRSKAMKRLRVPPISERHNPKAVFRFGFFAGIFLVQTLVIILSGIYLRPLPEHYLPAIRMFRSTFLLILFLCLFGLNTYGWRSSGVNHVLIFEINPRSHLDHFQLLELSFFLADLWGFAVLFYMYSEILNVPGYISPFVLVIFLFLCLLNPFKFFQFRARRWLLRILGRIFSAPFHEVKFADFWLADQLNSLSFLFPEIAYFLCFYSSQIDWSNGFAYTPAINGTWPACAQSTNPTIAQGCQCTGILFGLVPVLRALPAWFRFAQCLRRYRDMKEKKLVPHVINAGKYSTTFLTAATSAWFEVDPGPTSLSFYIIASIINSSYTYAWDIRMDWGLCECDPAYRLLREETVYRHHAYYYGAIIEDFILRFSWTFKIGFMSTMASSTLYIQSILPTAEVIRRFIWNFFRLENEHLNNCGEFRAVRDIFIRPERREFRQNSNSNSNHHGANRRGKPDDTASYAQLASNPPLPQAVLQSIQQAWSGINRGIRSLVTNKVGQGQTTEIELRQEAMHSRELNDDIVRHSKEARVTAQSGEMRQRNADYRSSNHRHVNGSRDSTSVVKPNSSLSIPQIITPTPEWNQFDEMGNAKFVSSLSSISTTSSKSKSGSWDSGSSLEQETKPLHPTSTTITLLSETPSRYTESNQSIELTYAYQPTKNESLRKRQSQRRSQITSTEESKPEQIIDSNENDCERVIYIRNDRITTADSQLPKIIMISSDKQLEGYENPRKAAQ